MPPSKATYVWYKPKAQRKEGDLGQKAPSVIWTCMSQPEQQLHCLGKKVGAALLNLETSSAFLIEVSVSLFTAVAAPALEHSKRMAQWTSDSMAQEAVFVLTELRKVFIVSAWA